MKRTFAVAACGLSLATALAGTAADAAPTTGGLHATLTPHKNVKSGATLTMKATNGLKSQLYYCSQILIVKGSKTQFIANTATVHQSKSSKKGTLTCKEKFVPFKGTYGGKTHHCPTTKADKKAGWSCAFGVADVASQGAKSGATLYFTGK